VYFLRLVYAGQFVDIVERLSAQATHRAKQLIAGGIVLLPFDEAVG
jgi:hypothetical protein